MGHIVQNDQLLIDNMSLWYIDRNENVLYRFDIKRNEYELISILPTTLPIKAECAPFYRITPYCYKKDNLIFCMPDRGDSILVYDLRTAKVSKIDVYKTENVRLSIHDFWDSGDRLWAISYGLSKILEINTNRKIIEKYYDIFDNEEDLPGYETEMVNGILFCISRNSNRLCKFNIKTKKKEILEIPGLKEGINTICYDKNKFWFSGISGRIYVWDGINYVLELNNYPKEIEVYGIDTPKSKAKNIFLKSNVPVFYRSFFVNETVCFLPFNLDQAQCDVLLCVNKKDYYMWGVKLLEEGRNRRGIYTLEYVSSNGRIGILFSGNDYIFDYSVNEDIVRKIYTKNEESWIHLFRLMQLYPVIHESEELTLALFEKALQKFQIKSKKKLQSFGKNIFNVILNQ